MLRPYWLILDEIGLLFLDRFQLGGAIRAAGGFDRDLGDAVGAFARSGFGSRGRLGGQAVDLTDQQEDNKRDNEKIDDRV